jgi:hypothetical protein
MLVGMIAAVAERKYVAIPLVFGTALLGGVGAAAQPKLALGFVVACGLVLVAFRAPVASYLLLLFLTCVVPYGIQNRLGIGGGVDSPGLLLSDILLVSGILRALLLLARERLDRRCLIYALLLVVFLVIAATQFVHGLELGGDRSRAGQEFRVLLGFGSFLIALPLLAEPATRRRLLSGLTVLAMVLGAWGMLQWLGHFDFGAAGDVGVRTGVRLTSNGTGQLQGGEFGFPVVIVACFAVLLYGAVRSRAARAALVAALVLNVASCLVTFERTFWLDTLLGMAFVVVFAPAVARIKFLLSAPIVVALVVVLLSFLAPAELTTAHQRLLSLGDYASDASVRYRRVESDFVLEQIGAHPIAGSGLAATIFWGQPWAQVPPKASPYAHDGYLWLAWKVGIPGAALLVLLLGSAILLRRPRDDDLLTRSLRRGAQGALAGLLLATVTFPSFSVLSITPAIGALLALAIAPAARAISLRDGAGSREASR